MASDLFRIKIVECEGDHATFKIFAIHPDASHFPGTKDFLLQLVVTVWDHMRNGYDFIFDGLDLSPDEMRSLAAKHPRAEELTRWAVLISGDKRDITEAEWETLNMERYGSNPPKEAFQQHEAAKAKLEKKFGARIVSYGKSRLNASAPMEISVRLAPDTEAFADIAEEVVEKVVPGTQRAYKNWSKSTQSYAHSETTFTVNDPAYLWHLRSGVTFDTANVAFRR